VSWENAQLNNECGANCTAEDFRRIDQQMAKLESAGTLAEIGKRSTLTPEQANNLAQLAIELAPGYGSGESLMQAMTGRSSVSDEEVSRFWAAVGVVPVAGGVLRRVGEPAVDALATVFKGGRGPASALDAQLVGREVAGGHAFEKHVLEQGEFKGLGIRTREQFAGHVENVVNSPSGARYYKDGRVIYLQESTGTVVIRNPSSGESTAFQPKDWAGYVSALPQRSTPY